MKKRVAGKGRVPRLRGLLREKGVFAGSHEGAPSEVILRWVLRGDPPPGCGRLRLRDAAGGRAWALAAAWEPFRGWPEGCGEKEGARKGHPGDALAPRGEEGRSTLRKARGRCERSVIPGSPNGATHLRREPRVSPSECIGGRGEPGELKHLSSRRKGHQQGAPERTCSLGTPRDSASSGERKRTRPVVFVLATGSAWKGGPKRVRAPYGKAGRRILE